MVCSGGWNTSENIDKAEALVRKAAGIYDILIIISRVIGTANKSCVLIKP